MDVEIRGIDRPMGRNVGMMMRRGFDGPNRGMYFIYKHPRVAAFWMKNCFIPIDIAYVRDDTIEDIQTGQPGALRPATEQVYYEPRARYNRVLEMPGGWFAEHGIGVGDRVEPPE